MNACFAASKVHEPLDGRTSESRTLLDLITRELQNMVDYEADMRFSKSILAQCRNSAFAVSPINGLPSEVLAHIFTLLSGSNGCLAPMRVDTTDYDSLDNKFDISMPKVASQVCARWRKIALAAHEIWTHIDVITSEKWGMELLSRNEMFADRAGPLRLRAHISTPRNSVSLSSGTFRGKLELTGSRLAPKIESFRLDDWSEDRDDFSQIINCFFQHISPGVLTELVLLDHSSTILGTISVVDPNGPSHERDLWSSTSPPPIWMSTKSLDEILCSVKVLSLKNRFFPWASQAYSGLVELRLLTYGALWGFKIEIVELLGILASCPDLRAFQCYLEVNSDLYNRQLPMIRVSLRDLEELRLDRMAPEDALSLLTHIHPGSKSLSMSIPIHGVAENLADESFPPPPLSDFLSRSNVERLYLARYVSAGVFMPLDRLLPALPSRLRILGFTGFYLHRGPSERWYSDGFRWPKINTLLLDWSQIDSGIFQRLVTACSTKAIGIDHRKLSWENTELAIKASAEMGLETWKFPEEYGIAGDDWMML